MKKSSSQDRKRVSSEKHEVSYTGRKVAKATGSSTAKGRQAVKKAKRALGRSTSRPKVERRAKSAAR